MKILNSIMSPHDMSRQFPEQFSIREVILGATAVFLKEWQKLLILQAAVFVLLTLAGVLVSGTFPGTLARFIAFALDTSLQMIVGLGLMSVYIKYVDGEQVELLDIFDPIDLFWSYAGVMILYILIVGTGILALVIPGLIAACGLCFSQYLVVDTRALPADALRLSWKKTEGHKMTIALFLASLLLLNVIGFVSVVGIIVTTPISGLAYAIAYRYFFPKVVAE